MVSIAIMGCVLVYDYKNDPFQSSLQKGSPNSIFKLEDPPSAIADANEVLCKTKQKECLLWRGRPCLSQTQVLKTFAWRFNEGLSP